MKDKVFIAWSGSNSVALKVKRLLEKDSSYMCYIGGNSDNDSRFASVGDTVIQQIKDCNQAIVIFQNRADGAVSNNLFFELGYVFASYGATKVHCVRRSSERIVLPSDFDNSFVEAVDDSEKDDDLYAERIVDYFMKRQKMSITMNKMYLMNNRYIIHGYLQAHYSSNGSKCSDYELAQYLLFYTQAAHLFNEDRKVRTEIQDFKSKYGHMMSPELTLSVSLSTTYLSIMDKIKVDNSEGNNKIYMDKQDFWTISKEFETYYKQIHEDDAGIFDEWASIFNTEFLAFVYMLFAENTSNSDSIRKKLYEKTIEWGMKALDAILALDRVSSIKDNNDEIGIISLIRSYLFRNIYVACHWLKRDDTVEWLKKSLDERARLMNIHSDGSVDSQLLETFKVEYYLTLSEYLLYYEKLEIDELDLMMYYDEIDTYLEQVNRNTLKNPFVVQIEKYRDRR